MKWPMVFCLGMAVAGLAALPAFAQQERVPAVPSRMPIDTRLAMASSLAYREPLADSVARPGRLAEAAPGSSRMPVFPSGPTTTERVSTAALGFAAKSAFSLAASRTGTGNAVPPPSYEPYRPGMPVPEPGAEAIGCQPNGALTTPAACAGR